MLLFFYRECDGGAFFTATGCREEYVLEKGYFCTLPVLRYYPIRKELTLSNDYL